jgi:hypothetical protein
MGFMTLLFREGKGNVVEGKNQIICAPPNEDFDVEDQLLFTDLQQVNRLYPDAFHSGHQQISGGCMQNSAFKINADE